MSQHYMFRNAHEAAQTFAKRFDDIGTIVPCGRTGNMLELRNVCYDLISPYEKWMSFKTFKQNRLWAYSEVLTEFLGINPPLMERYVKDKEIKKFMKSFHRGDQRHNYTYGERWHNNQSFQRIIKRLQKDKYSRQAVMNIYDSSLDLDSCEWNVPCTIIHQFAIRRDQVNYKDYLHLNVYMRSNDFFRGYKYDTFLNSFILEAFAGALDCEIGILSFFIGSFHVHEEDFYRLSEFRSSNDIMTPSEYRCDGPNQKAHCSDPMPLDLSFEELYSNLWRVKEIEEETYYTGVLYTSKLTKLHPYFHPWAMAYAGKNVDNLASDIAIKAGDNIASKVSSAESTESKTAETGTKGSK